MQHEHDEKKRNLKEIEAEKEKREISQSQLVSEETEKGYEADKALKKIDEQMEYFGNDTQMFSLLSEQQDVLKKMQRDRMNFLADIQKENIKERRKQESREEEAKRG